MDKSPTIKSKVRPLISKKKFIRTGKQIESALELLKPELPHIRAAREQAYSENYMRLVKNTFQLENSGKFESFCYLIANLETNKEITVFNDLVDLFKDQQNLIDCFLPFLTRQQALSCGVFMDYLESVKMMDFLYMIETFYAKSPHQMKKIIGVLERLHTNKTVSTYEVLSSVIPLLRSNTVLIDHFVQFIPDIRLPERFLTDFEEVQFDIGNLEMSGYGELPVISNPEKCFCDCHETNSSPHCDQCSTRFINGRIFIESGKNLRRAKVEFSDESPEFHRDRLLSKRPAKKLRRSILKYIDEPLKGRKRKRSQSQSDTDGKMKNKKLLKSPKGTKSLGKGKRSKLAILSVDGADPSGKKEDKNSAGIRPWKIEEDRIILHTLQVENYCEKTFAKISLAIPSRSVADIKRRVQELLNLLYKMKNEG